MYRINDLVVSDPIGVYQHNYPLSDMYVKKNVYAARYHSLKSNRRVFQVLVYNIGELMWINVQENEVKFFKKEVDTNR